MSLRFLCFYSIANTISIFFIYKLISVAIIIVDTDIIPSCVLSNTVRHTILYHICIETVNSRNTERVTIIMQIYELKYLYTRRHPRTTEYHMMNRWRYCSDSRTTSSQANYVWCRCCGGSRASAAPAISNITAVGVHTRPSPIGSFNNCY